MLAALILIELVRRDALDAVAAPNKTSLVNQPDDDPGESSHEDIAGERRPRCKSAQLRFVVAIEAGKLLLDIRQNRRPRARGQCRRREHSIDRAGGKARGLVVRFENGPSGASRKSKCSCLLVKCDEAVRGQGGAKLFDSDRLSRFVVSNSNAG